jgi:hypothetical protein
MKLNMKRIILITLICLVFSCIGVKSKNGVSTAVVLMASDIGKQDQQSGVVQVSPGADNSPAGNGITSSPTPTSINPSPINTNNPIPTNSPSSSSNGNNSGSGIIATVVTIINGLFGGGNQVVSIPSDKAILRTKLFDDPVLDAANKSYVNFVVGYEFIESLFYNPTFTGLEIPPANQVILEIDHVDILTAATPITIYPTVKESKVIIYRDKHYFPFFTGLILPVGDYAGVNVYLKNAGKVRILDREYALVIETPIVSYTDSFSVQLGKVTTLESVTLKDYNDGLAGNKRTPTRGTFEKVLSSEFIYQTNAAAIQHMYINLVNRAANIHDSLTKLNINVESLSASSSGNSSFVLNRTPTQFEVLQLRNGYVGLAGANQIDAGNYEYFELALARTHSAEATGGLPVQLYMDEASQNIFRFYGPFVLKGGETFETFLHLDPNRSVYFTKDRGFVIDPAITLLSTVSMNPTDEETKIISSSGKFMNILASESDIVIRGSVTSVTPLVAANASGRNLIYSDVVLNVTKSLKGNVDIAPFMFRTVGGTVNGVKLEVSAAPIFKNGEEIILYLQRNKSGTGWKVTRGELGKVRL